MKKILFIGVGLVILLIIALFAFQMFFGAKNQTQAPSGPVTLTYWGLWEEEKIVKPVIDEFQKENPNITINYIRASSQNYRTRTQTQIKASQGPDVFRIHNTWLGNGFGGLLYPAPSEVFTLKEYQETFYPIAQESFVRGNQIFAAPMEVDGLAMFVNEDILAAAGITQIPTTWSAFFDNAVSMTVMDDTTKEIRTSGAAMGEVANVDHWSDILGLLLRQQLGDELERNLTSSNAAGVFTFYTKFVNNVFNQKQITWSRNMPPSTQAFAQGKVAFYFAPSWRAHELRQINPSLKFKIVPVPQLDPNKPVTWGSFWAEAVSANSKHPKEAWQFVKFLTSAKAEKLMYQEASRVRLFGEPYSRLDLKGEVVNDPLVGAFVNQAPYYKGWYLSSGTLDQGLNDNIIKYFEDGINKTIQGQDITTQVLPTIDAGVKQEIQKANNPSTPAPSGQNP
jgi:ABC-type glycerol-3-phosphate transport system substrate-binding protein